MKNITLVVVFLLSFLLAEKNPWILTTEKDPNTDLNYLVSLGPIGSGGYDNDEIITFKYGVLFPDGKNALSGFSFSGYSQSEYEWWFNQTIEQSRFLFAYSKMKSLFNKDDFSGLFYGYDVGLCFYINDEYPLGITLDVISEFFDDDNRSNIGLGGNVSIGYKSSFVYGSLELGFDWIGGEDFLFFLNYRDDLDFDINHEYTALNFGFIF